MPFANINLMMMNKLLTFLILFTLAAANPPETSAQKSGKTRKDSFCITSSGSQNQVIINTKKVTQINDCTDSLAVKGEIVQRGEKNSVEINTDRKSQASSRKPQAAGQPATSNKEQATIKIKQSGKNNNITINTR